MYKKQLTLTATVYLAILFTFTACNIVEPAASEPIILAETSIPLADIAENQQAPAENIEPEIEPTSTLAATSVQESTGTMTGQSNGEMAGGNNMGGNMMGGSEKVPVITNFPDEDIESADERQALELLVTQKAIAYQLSPLNEWHVEIWFNEEAQHFEIDLFNDDWDWISWGAVSLEENSVVEMYAPQPLSAEEYQAQQAQAEALVLADAEVLAVLGDPAEWERYAWYDEWEGGWEIGFYKGLDEISVRVANYDGEIMVDSIQNLALLNEEQQAADNKNKAIELAWGAEGIDEALFGTDEDVQWETFVTHIQNSQYGVSFATADNEMFFALVDIDTQQVLESNR